MTARERMTSVDTAWLRMDRPSNLMMIVGVLTTATPVELAAVRRVVGERMLGYRRFRQVPRQESAGAVWCDDPDFANLVLSARVTDLALSLPGNSGVLIGGGHIVVSLKEYVRPDEAVRLASLPAEFLSLLSPEVSVYQSPIRA